MKLADAANAWSEEDMMLKKVGYAAFALLASLALPASAQVAVLEFEELPHAEELQGVGDVVLSNGYAFLYKPESGEPYPVGFFAVGPSWRYNGRSTALLSNSCSSTTTLASEDGAAFNLHAMDLKELNGDRSATVVFTGVRADGSTVQRTVEMRGRSQWRTYQFPKTFRNLVYVRWLQGDCIVNFPHMFDNVILSRR